MAKTELTAIEKNFVEKRDTALQLIYLLHLKKEMTRSEEVKQLAVITLNGVIYTFDSDTQSGYGWTAKEWLRENGWFASQGAFLLSNYEEAHELQEIMLGLGFAFHNPWDGRGGFGGFSHDGECCADFSCCFGKNHDCLPAAYLEKGMSQKQGTKLLSALIDYADILKAADKVKNLGNPVPEPTRPMQELICLEHDGPYLFATMIVMGLGIVGGFSLAVLLQSWWL